MLTDRHTIYRILWVAVAFYPTLVDPISPSIRHCECFSKQPQYPGTEDQLQLCSFGRERRRRPSLKSNRRSNGKGYLSFVMWMDELGIIEGLECNVELNQLIFAK